VVITASLVVRVISLRPAWYVRKRSVGVVEKMRKTLQRLWEDSEGQDLVEYALIIILVSLLSVAAMKNLASGISNAYGKAASQLNSTT
jgi:pilus assembly protein Flp/PilA